MSTPSIVTNTEAGFAEFVIDDVPTVYRPLNGETLGYLVDIRLESGTRRVVGIRWPAPAAPSVEPALSPSGLAELLEGIKQFGLAADRSDLRDLGAAIEALLAERDALKAQVAQAEVDREQTRRALFDWMGKHDKREHELSDVSEAIGTVRFMDPPDGGDVSLAEQVARMKSAMETAEREATALRAVAPEQRSEA